MKAAAYALVNFILIGTAVKVVSEDSLDTYCEVNGLRLSKGERWQIQGQCVEATCQGNNATTALGCAVMQVDEASGWSLTEEDPSKPYPECCPQPVPPQITNTPQPPQCVEEGQIYLVGQQKDIPGWCGANVCVEDNTWSLSPCGSISVPEGWITLPEDLTKPYPDCCAKAVPSPTSDLSATLDSFQTDPNEIQTFDQANTQQEPVRTSEPSEAATQSSEPVSFLSKIEESSGSGPVVLGIPDSPDGDLLSFAVEDPEYWTSADNSAAQNVRSTFPNDQAGLKRLIPFETPKSTDQAPTDVPEENSSSSSEEEASSKGWLTFF